MPLLSRLLDSAARPAAPFHTPGHHGLGVAASLRAVWGDAIFAADLPELPELDNLFAPEEVIAESQALAAEAFGSDRTFFLVNGSTAGVMAAILATCAPGDKILLPRTVHRSVIAGLVFSGAQPVFVKPEVCPRTGLVGSVATATIAQALDDHPDLKAVLLVSPTYEGVCADIASIAQLCHDRNLPLLVDEAHGPHFGFHPGLPPSALSQGADLAVQSTHKVLSGLTQSAMLHLGRGDRRAAPRLHGDRVAQALQLVQSTSPSYLLLASLDAARMQMATQGEALMAGALALAQEARDRLRSLPGIEPFELPAPQPGFALLDLTRLTVDVRGLGQTGFDLDERLNQDHGVVAELPSLHHLTFIVSLGNRAADIDRLVNAFGAIAATPAFGRRGDDVGLSEGLTSTLSRDIDDEAYGEMVMTPRDAHFSASDALEPALAVGRISAETVCPYPPGIPVLLPGERISAAAIAHLERVKAMGGVISGASDPSLKTLRVVS